MKFSASEQTIAWFKDRYLEQTLTIRPPYQRKPVWVAKQKCALVESILKGLPIPEIFIQRATSPDGRTEYAVVDGQQRIRTIVQFVGSETDPDESDWNKFVLDKLDAMSAWHSLTFAELDDEERKAFYGYTFAVRFLDTNDEDDVRDMFMRLNRYLTPLNAQELRNSTYIGPFVRAAISLAEDPFWSEMRIFTPAMIRRMRDVEFMSDLLIGVLHGPQAGNAKTIDRYYERYEDCEDNFPNQRAAVQRFKRTIAVVKDAMPMLEDTRWSNKTDFYSLFVVIAQLLKSRSPKARARQIVRKQLLAFEAEVDHRLSNERASVSDEAVEYVRAVEKGATDKQRRVKRHEMLTSVITPAFVVKK